MTTIEFDNKLTEKFMDLIQMIADRKLDNEDEFTQGHYSWLVDDIYDLIYDHDLAPEEDE
jgi:hypothetical protein